MPIEIDETELTFYKRGQAKGRLEGKAEGEAKGLDMGTEIIFALQIDGKSPEEVAKAFGLPLEKVVSIQSRFQGKR